MLGAVRGVDVVYATGLYGRSTLAAAAHRLPLVLKLVNDPAYERARRLGVFTGTLEDFQAPHPDRRLALLKAARRRVIERAERIIIPSGYLADIAYGWGVPRERVRVVPNPAPSVDATTPRAELRDRLGFRFPTFVFAGRLTPQKNLPLAISALSRVADASLVVVGEGPSRAELSRAIDDAGVCDRVTLTGALPRADAIQRMRAADASILPSDWENFPHAAVEALAAGTPVVATAVGGVPEIVHSGINGLLVPPRDPDALAAAMARLNDDGELLREPARRRAPVVRALPPRRRLRDDRGRTRTGGRLEGWRRGPRCSGVRVLHVHKVSGIGGSERHLLSLLPGLIEAGLEVRTCVLGGEGAEDFVGRLDEHGVPHSLVAAGPDLNPVLVGSLWREMRAFRPDLVHTHLIHADLHGQLTARFAGIPGVSSVHSTHDFYGRQPYRSAATVAGRSARLTIAISSHVQRFLERLHIARPGGVRTVHYGIDASQWPSPASARARARERPRPGGRRRRGRDRLEAGPTQGPRPPPSSARGRRGSRARDAASDCGRRADARRARAAGDRRTATCGSSDSSRTSAASWARAT